MFEKEAEEYGHEYCCDSCENLQARYRKVFKDGAEFGYNKGYHDAEEHYMNVIDSQHKLVEESKANEWFDAKTSIPLPKKAEIYRYTLEVISDKGDIVCYDYKDKDWKKLVIEDEKVTYIPVEIEKWCNKPTKESE